MFTWVPTLVTFGVIRKTLMTTDADNLFVLNLLSKGQSGFNF